MVVLVVHLLHVKEDALKAVMEHAQVLVKAVQVAEDLVQDIVQDVVLAQVHVQDATVVHHLALDAQDVEDVHHLVLEDAVVVAQAVVHHNVQVVQEAVLALV